MSVTKYFHHTEIPQNVAGQIVASEGHREWSAPFVASRWWRQNARLAKVAVNGFGAVRRVMENADIIEVERQPEIFTNDGMDYENHNSTFAGGLTNRPMIQELT